VFLACEESSYTTGQVFHSNDGTIVEGQQMMLAPEQFSLPNTRIRQFDGIADADERAA